MADIAMGKVAEYAVALIPRNLSYVFCFNANIETLKDETEKLNDVKARVHIHVNAALRNVEMIDPLVQRWLLVADRDGDEARIIIQNKSQFPKGCFNGWCLDLKLRYALSCNAHMKRKDIIRLQQDWKFKKVSLPAPLVPVVASTSTARTIGTRESILSDIIEKLKDENINMIGICGMGGVGKTTIAEQVLKKITEEKLFDDCAMAVVSQKGDMTKVQSDIAEMLSLGLHEKKSYFETD